ncbi:MAG: hypothetical protein HY928_05140 [Elusimicrobia bacterium]|nr:hypothetical protein [Elusimicrobiota bacterium]
MAERDDSREEERRGGATALPWPAARPVPSAHIGGWLDRALGLRGGVGGGGGLGRAAAGLLSQPLGLLVVAAGALALAQGLRSAGSEPPGEPASYWSVPPANDRSAARPSPAAGESLDGFRAVNGGRAGAGGLPEALADELEQAVGAGQEGGAAGQEPEGGADAPAAGGRPVDGAAAPPGGALLRHQGFGGAAIGTGGGSSAMRAASAAAEAAVPRPASTGASRAMRSYRARALRPAALRGRGRSTSALSQLRFTDNRSRSAAARTGEAARYTAAEAFDGGAGRGGAIAGGGAGIGSGGPGVGSTTNPPPNGPIRPDAKAEGGVKAPAGENQTPYQQQMKMAIALLALAATLVLAAAVLNLLAKRPEFALFAAHLLTAAQVVAGIGAAVAASAAAIGVWVAASAGQTMQGSILTGAGAMLAALGFKVAVDSSQAASALSAQGAPLVQAKAGAAARAAAEMPVGMTAGGRL